MNPVKDVTVRLENRRRIGSRRRRLWWLSAAGLILALVLAWAVLWFSPVLAVRTVTVSGNDLLTTEQVQQAAAIPQGVSLLALDLGALADRIASLPAVAEVSLTRSWPDTVVIEVSEREPRLAIPVGQEYLIADASGVVFDLRSKASKGLIVVEADPGDRERLVDAGTVYSALSSTTAGKLGSIIVEGRDSITLRMVDGSRVFWGGAEDSALKAEVVDALLPLGGTRFDVSAPSSPTRR